MKRLICLASILSLLMACHGSVTVGDKHYDSDSGVTVLSQIKNNIQIKENGLKVSEAYLVKTADNTRIDDNNTIDRNENISLRLVISGWKEINGRVKPGAAEKITSSEGKVVLDETDLFKDLADASAKDAKFVTIDAEFEHVKKAYDGMDISFRVWDKESSAQVSGSYKVKMK